MSATTKIHTCVVLPQELAEFIDALKSCADKFAAETVTTADLAKVYALALSAFYHATEAEKGEMVYIIFPATLLGINPDRRAELDTLFAKVDEVAKALKPGDAP